MSELLFEAYNAPSVCALQHARLRRVTWRARVADSRAPTPSGYGVDAAFSYQYNTSRRHPSTPQRRRPRASPLSHRRAGLAPGTTDGIVISVGFQTTHVRGAGCPRYLLDRPCGD
jgi:hypothetical protein